MSREDHQIIGEAGEAESSEVAVGTRPSPADAVAAGTMVTVGPASGGTDNPFKAGREAPAARAQARAARVEEVVRASALAMEGESVAPVSEGNLVDAGTAGQVVDRYRRICRKKFEAHGERFARPRSSHTLRRRQERPKGAH
jgi:hypothetical protein